MGEFWLSNKYVFLSFSARNVMKGFVNGVLHSTTSLSTPEDQVRNKAQAMSTVPLWCHY